MVINYCSGTSENLTYRYLIERADIQVNHQHGYTCKMMHGIVYNVLTTVVTNRKSIFKYIYVEVLQLI